MAFQYPQVNQPLVLSRLFIKQFNEKGLGGCSEAGEIKILM